MMALYRSKALIWCRNPYITSAINHFNVYKPSSFTRNERSKSTMLMNETIKSTSQITSTLDITNYRTYASNSFFSSLKLTGSKYSKSELMNVSLSLLNGIYMKAPIDELTKQASLNDSFVIWFSLVTIHIWIVSARLGREGKDGETVFQTMLVMFWEDVAARIKAVEDSIKQNLEVKKKMKNYYSEAATTFCLLNEGIAGGDAVLASSLWTIFKMKSQNHIQAWHLEFFVHYIRYWAWKLDKLSFEDIISNPDQITFYLPPHISLAV